MMMKMPPVMMNGAISKAMGATQGQQHVQPVRAYNYQTGPSPSKLARDQIGQRLAEMNSNQAEHAYYNMGNQLNKSQTMRKAAAIVPPSKAH